MQPQMEALVTTERESLPAAQQIAEAFYALQDQEPSEPPCPGCGGDGWYVGHEDECYDTGDCCCSGVQIQCECQR